MRTLPAEDVIAALIASEIQSNIPTGKETLRVASGTAVDSPVA